MGLLQTADAIVDNSIAELNDVLNSKFTTYLQGNGTPVLVDYYNVNDMETTLNSGTNTPDENLGEDSPFRYNKIENFPVYGLKEFIPSKEDIESGLYSVTMDMEVTILPNTIRPSDYDYIVYRFLDSDTLVMFRVVDFEFSSIRSNAYYKLSLSLKDLNEEDYVSKLEKQVIKNMVASLDNIGTNEKCIIEDTTYKKVEEIKNVVNYMIERYHDVFYNKKFNAYMMDTSVFNNYSLFDPYLTTFLMNNRVLDDFAGKYTVLVNYDGRYVVKKAYNKTLFRNIELRDKTHVYKQTMAPVQFENMITNPFMYHGEGDVFTMDLELKTAEDVGILAEGDPSKIIPIYYYFNEELIDRIENYQLVDDDNMNTLRLFWNIIINYLAKGNLENLITNDILSDILSYDIEYNRDDFIIIPIVIYIMKQYIKYITNN